MPSAGQGAPRANPLPQCGDRGLGKLARRRHFQLGMGVGDGLDEQALVRLAGNHRRPGIAPLEDRLAAVQPQADDCFFSPWHLTHWSTRIGRTLDSKNSIDFAGNAGPRAACGAASSASRRDRPMHSTTSRQVGAIREMQPGRNESRSLRGRASC